MLVKRMFPYLLLCEKQTIPTSLAEGNFNSLVFTKVSIG